MQVAPVIPVLVIDKPEDAVPLATALVAGGLRVLEITLRSDAAMSAIESMAKALPEAIVGAGTVNHPEQMQQVKDAGAQFVVSPGFTRALGEAAQHCDMPYLPGVMTPAEILDANQTGLDALKFFPASQAGGPAFIKALGGPFQDIVFCPTGGINADSAGDYLKLANVLCVGGSWVAPSAAVKAQNWEQVTALATAACSLL